MASYNAGRSLTHLLTSGVFEQLRADKDGYITVAQAADQLLNRRRSSGFRNSDCESAQSESAQSDASMRSFIERTVAKFGISRPGKLSKKEFARMYETFVKRPAYFAQLMGTAADNEDDKKNETQTEEEPGLVPGPSMSREQLRSLVDRVNERLAEDQTKTSAGTATCSSTCCPPTSDGGFVLLGNSNNQEDSNKGKAGKIFENELQLD